MGVVEETTDYIHISIWAQDSTKPIPAHVGLRSLTVVDFAVMSNESPTPPEADGYHPQKHGTWAQWVAPAITLLIGIIMVSLQVHYRNVDSSVKSSDEHINTLIRNEIDPEKKDINGHIDKLGEKIDGLSERVARLEGPLTKRVSELEHRTDQQVSLSKLIDPNRILGTIRAELQVAQANGKVLPVSDLNDFRNAVQALSPSAHEYWKTVAAIINYQSAINQMTGNAPDPTKVSHVCLGLTAGTGGNNSYNFVPISNCVLDLDTTNDLLSNLVIKNSVIRYHGGTVRLMNVTFINCAFILDISDSPQVPAHPEVLRALLDSDQKRVTLSTHS